MDKPRKSALRQRIEDVLKYKAITLENAYTKSLKELVEDLKIYQYELEFQNEELQRIQEELERSRNDYRALFQFAPVGYVIIDSEMNVIECNDTFKKLIFASNDCNKQIDFRRYVHPENQDGFHLFCKRLINEKSSGQIEIRILHQDNSLIVQLAGNYFDSPDKPHIRLSFLDITDRLRAEENLNKTKELLLQTSRMARIGGWEYLIGSDAVIWSEVTYDIHEVEPGTPIDLQTGVSFYKEGKTKEQLNKYLERLTKDGTPFDDEFQIITAKGNELWVRAMGSAEFRNGNCVRLYGTFQNIDEKKHAQDVLKESEQQLKELNSAKDKLFSIIAHDLKNPFSSIMGLSEILQEFAHENDTAAIQEYAKVINSSASHAYTLLENLLDWARMQQNRIQLHHENLMLREQVDSVREFLKMMATLKAITIRNMIAEGIQVYADENVLKTLLRNLISNAVKFTPENGLIEISAASNNDGVIVSVKDNGVGIAENNIPLLFSSIEYFSTPGTKNENGSGLGLVICKELIEKHGGKLWVESQVGKGSTFYLTLPLSTA